MVLLLAALGCGEVADPGGCPTGDCRADLVDLAVGDAVGCALAASGDLACFGRNAVGQLASGDFAERSTASHVLSDAIAVDAGARHACAVRTGGRVACWGGNDRGQVSREAGDAAGIRTVVLPAPVVGVAAGDTLSCAWSAEGAVWCWGDDVPNPTLVPGIAAAEVAVAKRPCAREAGGAVVCWTRAGPVRWDARADVLRMDRDRPVVLRGAAVVRGVIDAAAGAVSETVVGAVPGAESLAIADGVAYVRSRGGEIEGFPLEESPVPLPIGTAALLDASGTSACAATDDGVRCWGVEAAGLRPTGTGRPTSIDSGGTLVAGGTRTCVVDAGTRAVRCHDPAGTHEVPGEPLDALVLGERTELAVRGGDVTTWSAGTAVPLPADQLGAGDNLACALDRGEVACWEPGRDAVLRPLQARSVGVGGRFACAVDGSGVVWCWEGADGEAQAIAGIQPATGVAVGTNLACASTEAGVWCWNHWRGAMAAPVSPVAAGIADPVQLAVGMEHACALDADGGVWCWGRNTAGQLGDGTRRGRTRAERVPGLPPARRIDAGHSHTCAEGLDGEIRCWGLSSAFGLPTPPVVPTDTVRAPVQ